MFPCLNFLICEGVLGKCIWWIEFWRGVNNCYYYSHNDDDDDDLKYSVNNDSARHHSKHFMSLQRIPQLFDCLSYLASFYRLYTLCSGFSFLICLENTNTPSQQTQASLILWNFAWCLVEHSEKPLFWLHHIYSVSSSFSFLFTLCWRLLCSRNILCASQRQRGYFSHFCPLCLVECLSTG